MTVSDRLSLLIKDLRTRAMVISALLIVVLSFYRAFAAGDIKVDGHGLSGVPVYIVFTGFIAGLLVYSWYFYKLWDKADIDTGTVRVLAYVLVGVFSLMLPMLSNDLYSLLAYGDAANRGVDVYTDVGRLSASPFFDYVSPIWRTAPCVYGPVSLGTSRLACLMAGGSMVTAIIAYKALAMLWTILFIEMTYRVAKGTGDGGRGKDQREALRPLIFIVLNPVFLLQGVGQLHCDMLAIALCTVSIWFLWREKWYMAFLFAGISIAAKMNYVLVLAFLVVSLFLGKSSWMAFFYRSATGLLITIGILFLLYFPYYTSADTFKVPFHFLFSQNPAKSVSEVLGDVIYFAPSVISGHHEEMDATMGKSSGVSDAQLAVWLAVKAVCQVVAFLLSAFVFIRFWMGERGSGQWMKVFLRLLLIFLLFYSHVFYAWYLMMLLPFVWFDSPQTLEGGLNSDSKRFMQWLFVLTCFSIVHDILCAVKHDTPVYFLVLPLTFLSIVVFFWRIRTVYFTSLSNNA